MKPSKNIIAQIKKIKWIKRWAGSYTFISCSYWGKQYDIELRKILGIGFKHTLFIHKKGTVTFLIKTQEFEAFGKKLANRVLKDRAFAVKLLDNLKKNTDLILRLMSEMKGKIPTKEQYEQFLPVFERHLAYHNFMKKTIDFIPFVQLDKYLPMFKHARIYSESVYSETESFFRHLAEAIALKEKKQRYTPEMLTCLTQKELEHYLATKKLPVKETLSARYRECALYFEDSKEFIITDNLADIDSAIVKASNFAADSIKGVSAYPGKVKGVCRIILDPHDPKASNSFSKGDILITGMTRPEFLPYFRKASAVVTDVGGMLCHAAVTARELSKPCVVGTVNATTFFKDGEVVEVDAEKGIVTKSSQNQNIKKII
jgi:phosphohistidine swiveling domain-containing protein